MDALVAYSSDEDEEEELSDSVPKETPKVLIGLPGPKIRDEKTTVFEDDKLDDVVKRHDWEHSEAPKLKPVKIDAFSHLSSNIDDDDDDEDYEIGDSIQKNRSKIQLLAMLPEPKIAGKIKKSTILVPSKVAAIVRKAPVDIVKKTDDSDKEDDDLNEGDFFGLAQKCIDPIGPSIGAGICGQYGPAKPDQLEISTSYVDQDDSRMHPSKMYNLAGIDTDTDIACSSSGTISNLEARKLIYKHELAPWGFSDAAAQNAVDEIIDVSVDQSLGPDVQTNLLRNLSERPVHLAPKLVNKDKEKKDVNAKRKHQITYLAQVAVERQELLEEQWAQNKQRRRMAAQKYGF